MLLLHRWSLLLFIAVEYRILIEIARIHIFLPDTFLCLTFHQCLYNNREKFYLFALVHSSASSKMPSISGTVQTGIPVFLSRGRSLMNNKIFLFLNGWSIKIQRRDFLFWPSHQTNLNGIVIDQGKLWWVMCVIARNGNVIFFNESPLVFRTIGILWFDALLAVEYFCVLIYSQFQLQEHFIPVACCRIDSWCRSPNQNC